MMILPLSETPELQGPQDKDYKGRVPKRALFLAPDACASLIQLVLDFPRIVFTDVFRSAEASLLAVETKMGTLPPGYSAHGFGMAFDLDLNATYQSVGISYRGLRTELEKYGWYCHRRDLLANGSEAFHFNFLGKKDGARYLKLADLENSKTWKLPVEAKILERFGDQFVLDPNEVQLALSKLHLYSGEIDGKIGPLSTMAIRLFQKTWNLIVDGVAGPRTQRTLAYVTAARVIVPPQPEV